MKGSTFKLDDGREFEMRKASLAQVERLSPVLGVDILNDDLRKIDWKGIFLDEARSIKILELILIGEVKPSIKEDLTAGDYSCLVLGFCSMAARVTISSENGLGYFKDMINRQQDYLLQRGTPSSSPSTPSDKATLS